MPSAISAGVTLPFANPAHDQPDEDERLEQSHQAVRPFEHNAAVQRGDEFAVAEWPIGAGQTRAVDADPAAKDRDSKSQHDTGNREATE